MRAGHPPDGAKRPLDLGVLDASALARHAHGARPDFGCARHEPGCRGRNATMAFPCAIRAHAGIPWWRCSVECVVYSYAATHRDLGHSE